MSSDVHIQRAVLALRRGGLVLHATEGVWGIACDPWSREAVTRLLTVKERRAEKGLILIGGAPECFEPELAALNEPERREVVASWPGAVTWLLPNVRYPFWITGAHDTVAVRVPAHPQARALCRAFGSPLVSTSANVGGRPPARTALRARVAFRRCAEVAYVLPGETLGYPGPSQIRTVAGESVREAPRGP